MTFLNFVPLNNFKNIKKKNYFNIVITNKLKEENMIIMYK